MHMQAAQKAAACRQNPGQITLEIQRYREADIIEYRQKKKTGKTQDYHFYC